MAAEGTPAAVTREGAVVDIPAAEEDIQAVASRIRTGSLGKIGGRLQWTT